MRVDNFYSIRVWANDNGGRNKMKRLINWWKSLQWDSDRIVVTENTFFTKRDNPLTWKQLLFRDKRAVITTIITLITLLVLISSTFAYDKTFTDSVGTLSLPASGEFVQDFTLQENKTLFFNTAGDSRLELDIPTSYYLNNTNTYDLPIKWSVDSQIFASNVTLTKEIIITNSANNKTISLGVIINVTKETEKVFSIVSTSSNFIYRNGTFYKNVSILHDFPSKDNIVVNLEGKPNELFRLTGCDDDWFLACKNSSFNLDNQGTYNLQVPVRFEFTPLGKYNETFYIASDTKNITLKAVFDVQQPQFKLSMGLIEGCKDYDNLPFSKQMNCSAKLLEYQAEGIIQLNEYYAKVSTENVCKQFIKTEYVVGDSISKEVLDNYNLLSKDYKSCMNDKENLLFDLKTCDKNKNEIVLSKQELEVAKDKELIDVNNENTRKAMAIEEQMKTESEQDRDSLVFKLKVALLVGFFLSFIAIGLKLWYDSITGRVFAVNVYVISVFVIGMICLFSWIGLFIWG
jgi:hypothetical protein